MTSFCSTLKEGKQGDGVLWYKSKEYFDEFSEKMMIIKRRLLLLKIQNSLIIKLRKKYAKITKALSRMTVPNMHILDHDLLDTRQDDLITYGLHFREMQVYLQREKTKLGLAKYFKNEGKSELKLYANIFYDIKFATISALEGSNVYDEEYSKMNAKQFANYVLDKLLQCELLIKTVKVSSVSSVGTRTLRNVTLRSRMLNDSFSFNGSHN